MLKEMVASNAAKLIAACVCPVVGTAAVTMGVPKVRSAVHRMTAPAQPQRTARAKPRVRLPAGAAGAQALPASAGVICPDPVILTNNPFAAPFTNPVANTTPIAPADRGGVELPTRISFGGTNFIPAPGLGGGGGGLPGGGGGGGGGTGGGGGGETVIPPAPPPGAVPEPATWAQLIVGFGVIGGASRVAWRQRSKKETADA